MHFRVRGNNVQLIKSVTDPESGKARSQPIGSVNLQHDTLPDRVVANLTPEERGEVEAWIARNKDLQQKKRDLGIQTLGATLSEAAEWIREADPRTVEPIADEIRFGLQELRRALHAVKPLSEPEAA